MSNEQLRKTKETNNFLYGVNFPLQSTDILNKTIQSFANNHNGISCIFQTEEFRQYVKSIEQDISNKRNETKHINNTFTYSKDEELANEILIKHFGSDNVYRQYKSKEYPFLCDFYISSQKMFIECNFHWTHGQHFFNPKNKEDLERIQQLKVLAETKNSEYYKSAIEVWINRDLKKLQTAIENKLNYLVFWTIDEFISFFDKNET